MPEFPAEATRILDALNATRFQSVVIKAELHWFAPDQWWGIVIPSALYGCLWLDQDGPDRVKVYDPNRDGIGGAKEPMLQVSKSEAVDAVQHLLRHIDHSAMLLIATKLADLDPKVGNDGDDWSVSVPVAHNLGLEVEFSGHDPALFRVWMGTWKQPDGLIGDTPQIEDASLEEAVATVRRVLADMDAEAEQEEVRYEAEQTAAQQAAEEAAAAAEAWAVDGGDAFHFGGGDDR
jgi:hypothetical protein